MENEKDLLALAQGITVFCEMLKYIAKLISLLLTSKSPVKFFWPLFLFKK